MAKFYLLCANSLGSRCKRGYAKCQPKKCRYFWQPDEKWKLDVKQVGKR